MKHKTTGKSTRTRRGRSNKSADQALCVPDLPESEGYEITSRWAVLALAVLTLGLSLPLFAPWSFWPIGYVVFVPWLIAVCAARRSGWVYFVSYLFGSAFFLIHVRWLYSTTPEGYVISSLLWLAPGFPLAAWLIRHLCRKRKLSVQIAFPIAWVAIELLRSRTWLAFPWFLLGHSQIRLLPMIQIADVAGVYGVSFVVAIVNGWLVDLVVRRLSPGSVGMVSLLRARLPASIVMLVVLLATVGYGQYRLGQSSSIAQGPRIAVIQGDFALSPVWDPDAPTEVDKRDFYMDTFARVTAESPDMVVLPETPWSMYLNRELREIEQNAEIVDGVDPDRRRRLVMMGAIGRAQNEQFIELSQKHQMSLVVGSLSEEPQPDDVYPHERRYNSAFVYTPGVAEPARYDKIHLVPFGEYIPFRFTRNMFWLYRFLNDGPWNPWRSDDYEYSLVAGDEFATFEVPVGEPGEKAPRFGITICYEDVIPGLFRRFVVGPKGAKRVDFMLNISNDGWFGYGSQQAQHLVKCAFRAVENRVGIARAVNTGVSGFVDSDGSWHDLVVEPGRGLHSGGTGYSIARLGIDPRVTFYSVWGDVFGWACAFVALLTAGDAIVSARRSRRKLQEKK